MRNNLRRDTSGGARLVRLKFKERIKRRDLKENLANGSEARNEKN
jgi:hypothetical protein